jgi:hypothetical protein
VNKSLCCSVLIVMFSLISCSPKKQPENTAQNVQVDNAATRYAESLKGDVGSARDKADKANERIHAMEADQQKILEGQ